MYGDWGKLSHELYYKCLFFVALNIHSIFISNKLLNYVLRTLWHPIWVGQVSLHTLHFYAVIFIDVLQFQHAIIFLVREWIFASVSRPSKHTSFICLFVYDFYIIIFLKRYYHLKLILDPGPGMYRVPSGVKNTFLLNYSWSYISVKNYI